MRLGQNNRLEETLGGLLVPQSSLAPEVVPVLREHPKASYFTLRSED